MKQIAIIYGSTTDNTKQAASLIAKQLNDFEIKILDIDKANISDFEKYNNLILGTSTWGFGDLQDDWDSFLPKMKELNLEGKLIALYGLGDSVNYPDTFIDGVGTIYNEIKEKPCQIVGSVSADAYNFTDSTALKDGEFVGLALDEDNESDLTQLRIQAWVEEIKDKFI